MGLSVSDDLVTFNPMVLNPTSLNVNAQGDIQYDLQGGDGKKILPGIVRVSMRMEDHTRVPR